VTFLWGVATSAYQIEGARENDWTAWEADGKLKPGATPCGEGSGHRRRWEADLRLLPTLGANAYRYSIEWSRIEPRPGEFDARALDLELRRVQLLGRLGIEPVVTLSHYTHPLWFWRGGGWESRDSVPRFARFAARMADALSPRVRIWVTLNEPVVLLLGGYLAGVIPPGHRRFALAAKALEHMLAAHVEAVAAIRERDPGARALIAHNMLEFAPDRPGHAVDRRLTSEGRALYNTMLLEAVATGRVRWSFPGEGRAIFRVAGLPEANDFVGVNYYSRVHLRFRGLPGRVGEFFYRDRRGRGLTQMGWEIHPEGFESVLSAAAEAGKPILVTENGVATGDDRVRSDFLREHVFVLAHARRAGLDVRGYFHWSLLDNFEWLEGLQPRFGLYEVDYATFRRRRRPSADLFAALGRELMQEAGAGSSAASRT